MKIIEFPPKNTFSSLTKRPVFEKNDIENLIKGIFEKVENEGDNALKFYAEKFDNQVLDSIEVSQQEIAEAVNLVDEELKTAINTAKSNIEKFHQSQKEIPQQIETTEGVICWRESRAIDRVGLYIPGGTAPLFSTVLMLAVPAQIAGCKDLYLNVYPGFTIMSQNLLSTSFTTLGYGYTPDGHIIDISHTFKGWLPVFNLRFDRYNTTPLHLS